MYHLVEEMRQRIGVKGRVVGYGHVGDCTYNRSSPLFVMCKGRMLLYAAVPIIILAYPPLSLIRCPMAANLHLNISSPSYSEEVKSLIEPFVYEWTSARGGSISAEHGVRTITTLLD